MGVRAFLGALALLALPISSLGQTIAIHAENILPISEPPIKNGIVLVKDGKIAAVGVGVRIPASATVLRAHTVMPGLIDVHSYLGCYREASEPADSLTPELRAADAFDPTDSAILRALRSGVTTAAIMPPNTNVLAGQVAVIRLGRTPIVIKDSAGLKISISQEAASSQRNPTSRAGIAELLSRALVAAKQGRPSSSSSQTRLLAGGIPTSLSSRVAPLASLARGDTSAFIHAPTVADAELALQVMRDAPGARFGLIHPNDSLPLARELKSRGVIVVLGPLRFTDNDRVLSQAGTLARQGVPVAFCTDAPQVDPGSLRMTAHLAVKHGMPRESALRALTQNAATLLGVAGRTGSIAPSMDGDLLLLSGDPMDLTSRVQTVISGGKIAHQEAK